MNLRVRPPAAPSVPATGPASPAGTPAASTTSVQPVQPSAPGTEHTTTTNRAPPPRAVVADNVRKVAGLPAGYMAGTGTGAGAQEGMTGAYVARPTATRFVGYGDVTKVAPTQDGFRVDLNVYTSKDTDKIQLLLQLPVMDKKSGALTYLNLDLLTNGPGGFDDAITTTAMKDPVSGQNCFGGARSYQFSLAQINDYLKSTGLDLEVQPGQQLSISGLVTQGGHRVMNAASNVFTVPTPLVDEDRTLSPTASRVQQATDAAVAGRAEDMPLDVSIKLSQAVLDRQVRVGNKSVRVGDILEGEITTRLESEYKGAVTAEQMNSMITRAYALSALSERALSGNADAKRELEQQLGPDIVLMPVKRHWLATDGEPVGNRDEASLTIARDDNGWPHLDPMKDAYTDDAKLSFSQASGVARTRGNKQKSGHSELKLGGGVLDPATGIRQRVEIGLSVKPGATDEDVKAVLTDVTNGYSVLASSPLAHVLDEARKAGLVEALLGNRTLFADVTQIRHKFELKNVKTGTSAELSLDMVHAQTVRPEHMKDGQPREATFYVIEAELDHLQIDSSNVTEDVSATSKKALVTADAQQAWITQTAAAQQNGTVELEVMTKPQLHSNSHVTDGTFRETPSYKEYEGMQASLLSAVCEGFEPGPARQKSAHFAEEIGLIPPEATVYVDDV